MKHVSVISMAANESSVLSERGNPMARLLRMSLPLAVLVFLVGSGQIQNLTAGEGSSVEAPKYAEGDWWIFRVKSSGGTNEEIRVDYKNGKFESDDPTFVDSIVRMSVYLKDSKKKWFKFPLKPGRKWGSKFRHTSSRSGRTATHDLEVVVVGPTPQPVNTASGTYEVTEIRAVDNFRGGTTEFTYFYSSKTKSIVKMTAELSHLRRGNRHYEAELIKYSVR